ncbi:LOW QUALITY PROTEIN: tricarboxylate transport membrane protein TctA [Limimaricola cinnabarinus LL-001]|uniref:Tricarboxylate transport membrane protein TctA n=1 Tax=Limimaricola cinnabarinus LL-001 TaxID=1337093 RepID=U2YQ69_9RHOB|nr:LOW QUALITY PROTEIN: tricarboxylate transport membrane protein TctA [Limimaricola cinnabarinus LL-001]
MDNFIQAMTLVASWEVLAAIGLGAVFGLFVGATPGLSATMAAALLVPLTFPLSPVAAIGAIVACTAMSIFAGDIPAAFLRIPGTPASAAYMNELQAMSERGEMAKGLGNSMFAAVVGGLVGTAVLILVAPQLANFALSFSSYEYFWLALLGLSCATLVAGADKLKGAVSLALGVFVTLIGLDVVTGTPRYTFGLVDLQAGISLIAVLIGAFAIAEIMRSSQSGIRKQVDLPRIGAGAIVKGQGGTLWRHKVPLARGSFLGTVIGALPGAGPDIAAWIAYAISMRFSRNPEKYGRGSSEAVIGAGSANNAALAGAYVPALVFGIPGDSITAIVIGVLLIKGLQPGPLVFVTSPDLINAIYIVFILANLLILPLGIVAIMAARRVLSVRAGFLYPAILLLCIIGTFATNNALFDLWTLCAIGVLVWIMNANDYPAAPFVLGVVLGAIVEQNFMTSMLMSDGRLTAFFTRPIAAVLGIITLTVWLLPPVLALRRLVRRHKTA